MRLITITGKAQEVFRVIEWMSKVAGKVTLGDIVKYYKEVR